MSALVVLIGGGGLIRPSRSAIVCDSMVAENPVCFLITDSSPGWVYISWTGTGGQREIWIWKNAEMIVRDLQAIEGILGTKSIKKGGIWGPKV